MRRAQKRSYWPVMRITSPLPLEGPRRADLPVIVGEITRSFTIHLLRVSAKRDVGGSEREFGFVYRRRRVRTIVYENLIPVDLQVGLDADTPDMRRQLVRQIYNDGPGKAGRKTHIFDDLFPCAIRHLRFYRRGLRPYIRLPGSIHRAGAEIFDETVQEEPQRTLRRPFSQIQSQRVRIGKTGIAQIFEVANIFVVPARKEREHVFATIVPGPREWARFG